MAEPAGRTALVAGGSGLVGSRLLPLLLDAGEYSRVLALSRRPLPLDHPRLANRVLRFDAALGTQLGGVQCQDAFCCLGTTIGEAGSQQAFRAVDHDLVLQVGRLALAAGAARLVVISAVGASEHSRSFYLRVKGETERALVSLSFAALDIMQPSVLLGSRRELRPLEMLAQGLLWTVNPLLLGGLARYRGIAAGALAAAMLGAARSGRRGVNRYTYREMSSLAAAAAPEHARL
ncbi:MAG: oxidoreductase [Steroidobacteraceae bacterium]